MSKISRFSTSGLLEAILQTAAYADIFDYALKSAEIQRYLIGRDTSAEEINRALAGFTGLECQDGYYTLPGRQHLVNLRLRRQAAAEPLWRQAQLYGRWIARLPFVRLLAVTGSLAMNNVDADADIDYLIVTAPGHLWTCRALILGIVRLARLQNVHLCPNYLISTYSLVFPNHTLYTAHELTQMVPISGLRQYAVLRSHNRWAERLLPNALGMPELQAGRELESFHPGLQSTLEAGLCTPPGAWFEGWEKERKIRQLSLQQGSSPESRFAADYCKGHLNQHAHQTELIFQQRLARLALEPVS